MRRADEAREAGQYPTAVSHYSQVLEVDAENSEAYLRRGQVHRLQKNHQSALSDVNRALRIDSKNAEVHTHFANRITTKSLMTKYALLG